MDRLGKCFYYYRVINFRINLNKDRVVPFLIVINEPCTYINNMLLHCRRPQNRERSSNPFVPFIKHMASSFFFGITYAMKALFLLFSRG